MEAILKTIDSVATRQTYRLSCAGSGRELFRLLVAQADNTPASAGMTIETMMQSHLDNGLAENTLSSFSTFYHELDRYNRSLPAHQRLSDGVLAEKLSHVVRRV
eukprot:1533693-Pleurochrysis_carterae.AAC.1